MGFLQPRQRRRQARPPAPAGFLRSDETLARMVGSVRQVVNKQLQYWKTQGILNKKRNQIIINDLDAIYKEADKMQSSMDDD